MGLGRREVVQMSGPSLVILAAGRARRYGGVKQLAPVGMHGEGVIDLIASDAYAAGFEDIVIVINPDTGPEIQEHVADALAQESQGHLHLPDSTARHRERGARGRVRARSDRPFGVSNADDLYGRESFRLLGEHLATSANNCLVGFELERALVGELPVSRGTCMVVNGHLTEIVERRNVPATLDGFVADDGLEPRSSAPPDDRLDEPVGLSALHLPADARGARPARLRKEKEIQLSTFVGQILHHTPLRFDVMRTSRAASA